MRSWEGIELLKDNGEGWRSIGYKANKAITKFDHDQILIMNDFNNWNEVTKGLYRYVIAANVCYEIHIEYHGKGTDILTAKASLFIAGDWNGDGKSFFERECLLQSQPVFECVKNAIEDEKANQ